MRLKAGVPSGWTIYHKTGTGQILGPTATGFNDVAIVRAPDGNLYSVAVMIAQTQCSIPERLHLMQAVMRAVVASYETVPRTRSGF